MVEEKTIVSPSSDLYHDSKRYIIEIELPGASKEDIDLRTTSRAVCLNASTEDKEYSACYSLAHPIETDEVKANFGKGALIITAPLSEPAKGKKIEIKDRYRSAMDKIDVEE